VLVAALLVRKAAARQREVVVYTSSTSRRGPIFRGFEKRSGVRVRRRFRYRGDEEYRVLIG